MIPAGEVYSFLVIKLIFTPLTIDAMIGAYRL